MLRAPSTDRPETLPHGRNLTEFYKLTSKIRGAVPPKNWGPKTCKISVITNISGTAQDIHKRKTLQTMAIPPTFDEKSPVNFGPLTAWNYIEFGPTKMHFLGILYLGPQGVLRPEIFTRARD